MQSAMKRAWLKVGVMTLTRGATSRPVTRSLRLPDADERAAESMRTSTEAALPCSARADRNARGARPSFICVLFCLVRLCLTRLEIVLTPRGRGLAYPDGQSAKLSLRYRDGSKKRHNRLARQQ